MRLPGGLNALNRSKVVRNNIVPVLIFPFLWCNLYWIRDADIIFSDKLGMFLFISDTKFIHLKCLKLLWPGLQNMSSPCHLTVVNMCRNQVVLLESKTCSYLTANLQFNIRNQVSQSRLNLKNHFSHRNNFLWSSQKKSTFHILQCSPMRGYLLHWDL